MTTNIPITLFISWAHEDEELKTELEKHLAPLEMQGIIEKWSDRQIEGGQDWAHEIDNNLESADIILLLVSPDFVASKYCTGVELKEAMKRKEGGDCRVVPIILQDCVWDVTDFGKIQALPKDGRAITDWPNRNKAFKDVVNGILQIAEELREQRDEKQKLWDQYKRKAEELLSDDQEISLNEAKTLDELRRLLGLTSEEAEKIRGDAYHPLQQYRAKLGQYKADVVETIQRESEYLLRSGEGDLDRIDRIRNDLKQRGKDLGLKTEDAENIERPIWAEFEARHRAQPKDPEAADRRGKEETERKTQEGEDRRASEKAGRKAREHSADEENRRKADEESLRNAQAEAQRKGAEERRNRATEEAARKAEEEGGRRAAVSGTTGTPMAAEKQRSGLPFPIWAVVAVGAVLIGVVVYALLPTQGHEPTPIPPVQVKKESVPVAPAETSLIEMVQIPAGEFSMGSPTSESPKLDERPVHKVSVPVFELGKFEVTVEQFKAYVDDNTDLQLDGCSSYKKSWTSDPKLNWKAPGFAQSPKDPVVCVSLVDAGGYLRWLNNKGAKKGYRLPSESEWEYAARARTTGPRYWPRDDETCNYAVTAAASAVCIAQLGKTMPVGQKKANGFDLYDMLGNAWEWTQDCWNETYSSAPTGGEVWEKGNCNLSVVRGGSWFHGLSQVRAAFRDKFAPQFRSNQIGFRVARSLP